MTTTLPTALARRIAVKTSHLWLAAAMVFALVRVLPNISYPIGRDQAMYCVIGQGLLNGQQLYRDLWDNRPPTSAYMFTLIVKAFGPVMWGIGVVDVLWLLCLSYCIFHFAERYLGSPAAAIAVAFNADWHCRAGYIASAVPESFIILFIFAGFLLIAREGPWLKLRHFIAGLLLGAAFWAKFNAVAFFPLLLFVPYLDTSQIDDEPRRLRLTIPWRHWLSRVAVLAMGFACAVVLVFGYFWIIGAWKVFWEVLFEVMPRYAALAAHRKTSYWVWATRQMEFVLGPWTEIATLLALCFAWRCRDLKRSAPIFISAAIGFVSAASQVRFHAYYFETSYPFFGMIWGYLALTIYEGCRRAAQYFTARGWRLARVLVWIVFANVIYWPIPEEVDNLRTHYEALRDWRRDPETFYAHYPWPHPLEHLKGELGVVHYLKENSSPQDRMFVWGTQPLLYFLSQRRPPTRFFSNLGLISPWGLPSWRHELVRDLQKSPPEFIAVASKDSIPTISYTILDSRDNLKFYPELSTFIESNYRPVADFDAFTVYRRDQFLSSGRSFVARYP